ncbi:MAG TPA: hypothetical protein VFM18_02475 [Methanosarcina sp.]|nr:hypothetical protein [Methanosarcina sp.]
MKSEYEANLALVPKESPSWMKPSTCKRKPIPWYTKLWMWFKY